MKKFYRYDLLADEGNIPILQESTYTGIKETPRGWWIVADNGMYFRWDRRKRLPINRKWIPKESKSRFAYPTKKEAMYNLIKRTERRRWFAVANLEFCDTSLEMLNEKYGEL